MTPLSAALVLAPKLAQFARNYPDVVLDVTATLESRTDLVAARFDAGIHLGESIQRDMVAVRVSRDQRLAVVGSPGYFELHPSRIHRTICLAADASTCEADPPARTGGSLTRATSPSWLM